MKELSIEEKAKAYDEALKVLHKYDGAHIMFTQDLKEEMFPELKEESEDERIRKEIIDYIDSEYRHTLGLDKKNRFIAWLEKQGEKPADTDNKFIRMRETKPKDISEFLDRLTTVEQEFLWEHIAKIRELDKEERTPTDKVDPKFKVGDWVVQGNSLCQIEKVTDLPYNHFQYWTTDGHWFGDGTEVHLWTIQDAKDGDVLSYRDGQWIFIYKEKIDDNTFSYHTLYSTIHQDLTINDSGFTLLSGAIVPATKEQRDLLFQKMHEAGYEWDAEKKELKKIEQKPAENEELTEFDKAVGVSIGTWNPKTPEQIQSVKAVSKKLLKLAKKQINDEQKPVWSEEDNKMSKFIGNAITVDDASTYLESKGIQIIDTHVWLEELKDRVQPQTKSAWSEEDEKMLRDLHNLIYVVRDCDCDSKEKLKLSDWIESLKGRYQSKQEREWSKEDEKCIRLSTDIIDSALRAGFCVQLDRDRCVDWIKSIKDRVYPQPNQEWSEEDESMRIRCIGILGKCYIGELPTKVEDELNWLKSLRPQNKWKPSDEQMEALWEAYKDGEEQAALASLWSDLKKLKSE